MRAYFVQIAAVRMAASCLGKDLIDNYAFHGALPRFKNIALGPVSETEGIDNVPAKAEGFRFGLLCGKIIEKHIQNLNEKELLAFDAAVAKNFFMDLSAEKTARYTDAELRTSMNMIFRAMLKKAQIRTHTAKPGGEDINKWLASYYGLQQDFAPYVSSLVDAILASSPEKESSLFDKNDPIINLALKGKVTKETPQNANSLFGKILEEIINSAA
jgi:hypothetical protein